MQTIRKCVIWDLDNTLWNGVCLEGPVTVRAEVSGVLTELHRRGILQSIASRGEEEVAMRTLRQFGLEEFFLVPQINWLSKVQNITKISHQLNLSVDDIAFIDDEVFEREQVAYMLPDVLTLRAEEVAELAARAEFMPSEITKEAENRIQYYRTEINRRQAENLFSSREEFLKSCIMQLFVRIMHESDIPRVMELMTRTHQLNTTGLILEQSELDHLLHSDHQRQQVFVAELNDKFGSYGIIGTALIDQSPVRWGLKYFALSCRVMGRGIERAFLSRLIRDAFGTTGRSMEAEFRITGRNRMMRAMYQMMGFLPIRIIDDGLIIFRVDPMKVPDEPSWVKLY